MQVLTGNELLSGAVVYLDPDGNWIEELQKARVFSAEEGEALDTALAASKATGQILSLDTEAVEIVDGVIHPKRLRERIRAEGPTAPRFSRQTLSEDGHVSI